MRLLRGLAGAVLASLVSGCLLVIESNIDVGALEPIDPLALGETYEICFRAEGEDDECHSRSLTTFAHRGQDWVEIQPEVEETPLLVLFFRTEETGDAAVLRIVDEGQPIGVLLFGLVETGDSGSVVVRFPACTSAPGNAMGEMAMERGLQVDDNACTAERAEDFFALAAAARTKAGVPELMRLVFTP